MVQMGFAGEGRMRNSVLAMKTHARFTPNFENRQIFKYQKVRLFVVVYVGGCEGN